MDKNAIKKHAIWAREELIKRVSARAEMYGISKNNIIDSYADAVNGILLTNNEKNQRIDVITQIKNKGYEQVMEEVAYTWFNRFCALRFMEVNNYLPTHIRVFTDENNNFEPQIMTEAIHLELEGLDKDKVLELKEKNKNEELYKYLLITQCNALNSILPGIFQRIADYTELLFPDNILRDSSVIAKMIETIPQDNFDIKADNGQVEIIGWLYQYYNSERKNEVINIYKGAVKKEDIPAATQLFTTDWVVRYVIDNSVGRYWIERNPNSPLKNELKYFVTAKNEEVAVVKENISPEELTVFDPCMGSGHFLVYAFELLMKIYKECAYSDRDAVSSIIQNNLFGLDIDNRASQLAYFAVMMKAREYDSRFFSRKIQPKIYALQESETFDSYVFDDFAKENTPLRKNAQTLITAMENAKEYGSLIEVSDIDFEALFTRIEEMEEEVNLYSNVFREQFLLILQSAYLLSKKYAVVVTNPPYLNKFDSTMKKFLLKNFKDYSGDLFSVFMYRNFEFCKQDGYSGFMTPFVWMFIKTYEKLRKYIINTKSITSLVQMEYSAFEEATVPICSFVLKNGQEKEKGLYFKLSDFKGGMDIQKQKVLEAIADKNCGYFYETSAENFSKIPGSPIAYWVSEKMLEAFEKGKPLGEIADVKHGLSTGKNELFVRSWIEVAWNKIDIEITDRGQLVNSSGKYFPYNKGGEFRKWYGNATYILWYDNFGQNKMASLSGHRHDGKNMYFHEGITWSFISSSNFGVRYTPTGFVFDVAGSSMFLEKCMIKYVTGILCSHLGRFFMSVQNPTLNFQVGNLKNIPVFLSKENKPHIENLVEQNISISKTDWDTFETSWDFKRHPLV